MCTYAFENAPPALTGKNVYLWGNIVGALAVNKEAQESGEYRATEMRRA